MSWNIDVDNSKQCTGRTALYAVYSGNAGRRSTDLRYQITYGNDPKVHVLSGAFLKTTFNTGNPRFKTIEQSGFSLSLTPEQAQKIRDNIHNRLEFTVYDDRDHNGRISFNDQIVGRTTGLRNSGNPLPTFELNTVFYSVQRDGCKGDEAEVCQLKCDVVDSPLAIDMNGDGFALTSVSKGIKFDLRAIGEKQRIAWFVPNTDDALIAYDLNDNLKIDDGGELFGSSTVLSTGQTAHDGFEALKDLDSNGDGFINAQDDEYYKLLLWTDKNHDGIDDRSDDLSKSEVLPLWSVVSLINLDATEYQITDRFGNIIKGAAEVTLVDGQKRVMADIWFRKRRSR